MTESWRKSAEELTQRFKAGEIGAREIVDQHLERLDRVEPDVGAYLAVYPEAARQQADALDRRRVAGEELGALSGVPVAIKVKPQMVIESQIHKKKMEEEKARIAAEREAAKKADEKEEQNEEQKEESVKVKPENKDLDWEEIPDF